MLESRIEISSLQAKQKDLETLKHKQDELISELISKLKEDNLLFKSKLLSLSSFCFEKSMSEVIQNDFEYNDSAEVGIIVDFHRSTRMNEYAGMLITCALSLMLQEKRQECTRKPYKINQR